MNHRKNPVALAVAAALLAPLAVLAQSEAQPMQRIEITGSNIKRIDAETADPVQVLRRDDIIATGATTVKQLLDSLPSASSTLSDISGSNSFAGGASAADLRGLGKQSTLILLNSRRVSPFALADFNEVFSNLDSLPIEAVERVEILKTGASAIYGSDAVAGVINIITRKDYQGLEVGANAGESLVSHRFKEQSAHIAGGFGNLDNDHYNIMGSAEVYHRESVIWRDMMEYVNPTALGYLPKGAAQYSTFSYPGNAIGGVGPIPGCPADMVIGGLCRYDRYTRFEAQPKADRANLFVSGRVKLGENLEAFSEVLFSRTKTTYISPFAYYGSTLPDSQWGNPSTGQTETFSSLYLPATHPDSNGTDPFELRYRFADSDAHREVTGDDYRVLAGLKGSVKSFDWESALGFLGSSVKDDSRGQFSVSGFKATIGDYTNHDANFVALDPNFFNQPNGYHIGQPNSADVLNRLFPVYSTDAKTTQVAWDGKISGEVAQLPAGPLNLAAGFDLRHERLQITPSDNLYHGDIVAVGSVQTDAARNFGAVFLEAVAPVTKDLEVTGAGRLDKFPGFAAHFSPKIGLRFQPMKELLLRGTAETGFRAPNLTEAAQSTKSSFDNGVTDPKRCDAASALAADLRSQAAAIQGTNAALAAQMEARADIVEQQECAAGVPNITVNNPDLKPEVSRSFSLGMVFQPMKNLAVSVDYWNIHRKDEIGLRTTQELLAAEGNLPPGQTLTRNPFDKTNDTTFKVNDPTDPGVDEFSKYGVTVGSLQSITNAFLNTAKTQTDGLDFGFDWATPTPMGKLTTGLQATYLLHYRAYSSTINDYGDNLAGRYGYSRFNAALTASLKTGNFSNTLRETYASPQHLQGDFYDTDWTPSACAAKKLADCTVNAYQRLDYNLSYTGVKNLTVDVFIRNILNEYEPFDAKALGVGQGPVIPQQRDDAQRRSIKLSLTYKFF